MVPWPVMAMMAVAWVWLVLVIAVGVLPVPVAAVVYAVGSTVCHQIPARSFHLAGAQLAVCGRCCGIYLGAAVAFAWQAFNGWRAEAATDLVASTRRARQWLMLGAAPTAVTVSLELAGRATFSNTTRAAAGLALGIAVALVAGRAATLHYGRWPQRRRA